MSDRGLELGTFCSRERYLNRSATASLRGRGMTIVRQRFHLIFPLRKHLFTDLLYLSGGSIHATVTGKPEHKRGNGLELPCKVTVNAPFFICSKVEPIIRDLCSR